MQVRQAYFWLRMERELFLRVKQQGYRAMVHQGYVHHGLKFAGGHGDLSGADFIDKLFVKICRICWWRGGGIGGASSLAAVAEQGELGNHQYLALCFKQGKVHQSMSIIEDAEVDDFFGQKHGVFLGIIFAYAEQDQKPRPYGSADQPIHANRGLSYSLHYGAQEAFS